MIIKQYIIIKNKLGLGKITLVISMLLIYRDISSSEFVKKYSMLSNIGKIKVIITSGKIIIVKIGISIIFSKILIKFISQLIYIVIGIDTKKDIKVVLIIFLILFCSFLEKSIKKKDIKYEYIKPVSQIINGFIIREIMSVISMISILLIPSLKILLILKRIFMITLRSNDEENANIR